jgi:hypothetical protein
MISNSKEEFTMLYAILIGGFYLMIILMYGFAEPLYQAQKKEEFKDGTKMVIKLFTLVVSFYIFILQIPLVTVILQGYLCQEDPDDILIISGVVCGSLFSQVLVVCSTVTLFMYLIFISVQELIYTSSNYETKIPWGQLDRQTQLIKVIWKLLMTIGFVFDKYGRVKNEIGIACFILGLIICYKRFKSGIIFE